MPQAKLFSSVAIALAFVALSSAAFAQQPPDIVKLKSGAMYRGTIRELVPNAHVEIMLVGGGTKTFKFDEVDYAGPDKAAAPAAPAAAPAAGQAPAAGGATIAFRAEPDLTLHEVTGSSYGIVTGYRISGYSEAHSFRTLCTAPCTVALSPGTYELAISRGQGKPVIASRVVIPAGASTANGEYNSRTGTRVAGFVVLIAGLTTGVGMMLYGLLGDPKGNCTGSTCTYKINQGLLWGGLGITLASSIVGTILASRPDKATIEVAPGVSGLTLPMVAGLPAREGAFVLADHAAARAQGFTVTARW